MDQGTDPFSQPVDVADGLGRMVLQRRGGSWVINTFSCVFFGPMGLLFGAGIVIGLTRGKFLEDPKELGMVVLAFLFSATCLGIVFYYLNRVFTVFRIYQRGITKTSWWGRESLIFDEIERFWYTCSFFYTNGAYSGNSYELQFYPFADNFKKPLRFDFYEIKWNTKVETPDPGLTQFSNWFNIHLANQMRSRLDSGKPVFWTDRIRFLPQGLACRSVDWDTESEKIYPYASISRFEVSPNLDRFLIFSKGNSEPILVEKKLKTKPNNVPGLMLLRQLVPVPGEQEGPIDGGQPAEQSVSVKPDRHIPNRTYGYGDPTNGGLAGSGLLIAVSLAALCWAIFDQGPMLDKRNQVIMPEGLAWIFRWFLFGLSSTLAIFLARWTWIDRTGKRRVVMKADGMFVPRSGYWFATEEFVPYREIKELGFSMGPRMRVNFQFAGRKFQLKGELLEAGVFEEFVGLLLEQVAYFMDQDGSGHSRAE